MKSITYGDVRCHGYKYEQYIYLVASDILFGRVRSWIESVLVMLVLVRGRRKSNVCMQVLPSTSFSSFFISPAHDKFIWAW